MNAEAIDQWLARQALGATLEDEARAVLSALPGEVVEDLLGDPAFGIAEYDPRCVRVAAPAPGRPGRSVLLRRSLADRPRLFVRWVIAHELAHAYLRNSGGFAHHSVERETDAQAAAWGFPRPERA